MQRIFCTKADREKTNDPNLHYYSKSRKDIFITAILTLVLLCLLILPVFILYRGTVIHNLDVTYTASFGVLLVFTLVFSAVLSLFTQAKRHEIFGAAAAWVILLLCWWDWKLANAIADIVRCWWCLSAIFRVRSSARGDVSFWTVEKGWIGLRQVDSMTKWMFWLEKYPSKCAWELNGV